MGHPTASPIPLRRLQQNSRPAARRLVGLVFCAFLATSAFSAEPSSSSTNEFIPETPSLWFQSVELRMSSGYKDNLLLDRTASEQSGFIASGLDWTVGRLPLDGRQFNFLLSADDTRYLQGRAVDHEDFVAAVAQFKLDASPAWLVGVDARYVYQDQVVDTSVTETNLASTLVRGHGVAVLPNVRWTFARNTWLELAGTAQRQLLDAPLDDYWEGGPRLTLGHDYGRRSSIALSCAFNHRAYDTREQVSLTGTNLPGTALGFDQIDVDLAWRQNWDPRRRWRTATRLGFQQNADNGPGFYDYRRYRVAEQVRYVAATWEVKAQAQALFYDFQHQTVDTTSSNLREKAIVNLDLRAEKTICKHLKLFAEYEYERSLSNRAVDEYHANKIFGGAAWEF